MTAAEARQRTRTALYFAALMTTLGLADPLGVVHLPILFTLKDDLGLRPPAVAAFEALMLLPVYFGLAFGLLRDRWQPGTWGDRGYFLLAAPVAIGAYLWLASRPIDYWTLLAAVLVIMVAFQFMDTSAQALMAVAARRQQMTGELGALSEIAEVAPRIVAVLCGGWLLQLMHTTGVFVIAALLTVVVALLGLRAPCAPAVPGEPAGRESTRSALLRLIAHRPLWPTIAILYLWNFAPGWATPFLYFLSDETGVSSGMFALCKAVNLGCIAATAVLYGLLCRRRSLRHLLRWSVGINAFPGVLFLFVAGAPQAIAVSAIVGLATGFGNVAVFDLLLRTCPKNLEGSVMTLGFAAFCAADVTGDLLGAVLYDRAGFMPCIALDIVATLGILPLMRLLPARLVDRRERVRASGDDHLAPAPSS